MKDVKFRIKHKAHGFFDGEFTVQQIYSGDFDLDGIPPKDFEPEDLEFIQYTGLKDKNGKEIYEGDIVEWCPSDVQWEDYESDGLGEVEFSEVAYNDENGRWCLVAAGRKCWPQGEEFFGCFLRGNIYENPELLKENNK